MTPQQEIRLRGIAHRHGYELCRYQTTGTVTQRGTYVLEGKFGDRIECRDIDELERTVTGLRDRMLARLSAVIGEPWPGR
jgi:hypothetical protein